MPRNSESTTDRATPFATGFVPFEITDAHRRHPDWSWLWQRLFQEPVEAAPEDAAA